MYMRMKRTLNIPRTYPVPFLKSKTGRLTDEDKTQLDHFIGIPFIH